MLPLKSLLPGYSLDQQLLLSAAPVVLMNLLTAPNPEEQALLAAWATDARWMPARPGFIGTQLHRAVGQQALFMNQAVWESMEHFRAAFGHPDFRRSRANYPPGAEAYPHLFARFAVPGICGA